MTSFVNIDVALEVQLNGSCFVDFAFVLNKSVYFAPIDYSIQPFEELLLVNSRIQPIQFKPENDLDV